MYVYTDVMTDRISDSSQCAFKYDVQSCKCFFVGHLDYVCCPKVKFSVIQNYLIEHLYTYINKNSRPD